MASQKHLKLPNGEESLIVRPTFKASTTKTSVKSCDMPKPNHSETITPIKAAIIKTVETELEALLNTKDKEIEELKLKLKQQENQVFSQGRRVSYWVQEHVKLKIDAKKLKGELEAEKKSKYELMDRLAAKTVQMNAASHKLEKLEEKLETRKRKWKEFKADMEGDGVSNLA